MPPPAAHRLSLLLLPTDPETAGAAVDALLTRLVAEGFVLGGRPGPVALVEGGFRSVRAEVFDRVRFASNWQGGFRVACPVTAMSVVEGFNRALEGWRQGGARVLACACGREHDLAALAYLPPAGFARGWLRVSDVASAELSPAAERVAAEVLGGVRVVLRRG